VAYPSSTNAHLAPKTVAHNAVVQAAMTSHSSNCQCGCAPAKKTAFEPLANNRNMQDSPVIAGFQDSINADLDRSIAADSDKYLTDVDTAVSAGLKKPSVVLESYMLSKYVAQMEANTDFFPKGTDKVVAGNCGKKVMSPNLRKKIFGLDFDERDVSHSTIDIIDYHGSVSYFGIMSCKNVWGCPVCARKLSEKRKKGLTDLLNAQFGKFGSDSVTASLFTIPHGSYDDLKDINKRLLKSYKEMRESRDYKKLMKKYGGCGSSRATEVTWSMVNGFHPHIHVLNFFENCLLLEIDFLADQLFALWTKAVVKNGFTAPSREAFGCKLVSSDKHTVQAVANYFTKPESDVNDADIQGYLKKHKNVRAIENTDGKEVVGWSVEHEMTKWHLKKARADNENYRYSSFDFVRGFGHADATDDKESKAQFRALWLTYREAFKGQRQLYTTHKHFKISELEMSDGELGDQAPEEKVAKVVYQIPFEIWLLVVYMGARGTVLEKARRSGLAGVEQALKLIREGYECLPENRRILTFAGEERPNSAFYGRVTSKIRHFALMSLRQQNRAMREVYG
jgi:hypothetical protein